MLLFTYIGGGGAGGGVQYQIINYSRVRVSS